jgi:hypothetical protein
MDTQSIRPLALIRLRNVEPDTDPGTEKVITES